MTLDEIITKRHSVRSYKDLDVDHEKILSLIEAARLAPSAKNRQPWKFYIAKKENKDKIANLMVNWFKENKNNKTSLMGTANAIFQAPVLILVFRDSKSEFDRSDTLSIGGAIEHILLKATELGLSSLWIADTWYVRKEISQLVGTELELYSAVSVGYSDENFYREKKSLNEILINKTF